MATKLITTEKATRKDYYAVSPADVCLGRNSRGPMAADYDTQVRELATSIAEHGQKVPAVGHKNAENCVVLDGGFKRLDAVKLLREGFTDDEGKTWHIPNATLAVTIDPAVENEKDAFLASIIENLHNPVTDVQEAFAHSVLREEFGYVNAEIARLYGYTNQNRVDKLERLIHLPQNVVDLVHEGKLAMSVAVENLWDCSPEVRNAIILRATDDTGKVQGAKVRELLRSVLSGEPITDAPAAAVDDSDSDSGDEPVAPAKSKTIKKTVKEILTFIDNYAGLEDGSAAGKDVCSVFARWIRDELKTTKKLEQALDAL